MLEATHVHKQFKQKQPSKSKRRDFFRPQYKPFHALKDISFSIKQGEKVAFIGPNGAGKSTMIKALLGILHYDQWSIRVNWLDPNTHRKDIATITSSVFGQRSQLLYHLPLVDSFDFFRVVYQIPKEQYVKRRNRLVEQFGIGNFLHQPVRKLSLGQRMKGEIIASLLHSPKIIFLDEPTVWLDIVAKKVLYDVLLDIHKRENITIFLTSHDMNDVEVLCERGIIINQWSILYDGWIEQLMRTYANKKIITYKDAHHIDWQQVEIDNDPALIKTTITDLFTHKHIEDMHIVPIPLEEIIEQFYQ